MIEVTRKTVRLSVAFVALWLGALAATAPAVAQYSPDEVYFLDRIVSVEGEVAGFAFGMSYANINLIPADKTIVGTTANRLIEWRPSTPLKSHGITAQSLKKGDQIIVTGYPHRQYAWMLLLKTITRPSDGWKWSDPNPPTAGPGSGATGASNKAPSTTTPAAQDPPTPVQTHQPLGAQAGATSANPPKSSPKASPASPTGAAGTSTEEPAKPARTTTLGATQSQTDQKVAEGTKTVVDDLRRQSEAALENASRVSACTQRAIQVNADQTSPAYRRAFDACMTEGSKSASEPESGSQGAAPALGAPWQPCGGKLRSPSSTTAVAIEFVNSSSQPRKLYWIDFGGTPQLYGSLRPGQRAQIQSYETHRWMVADGSDRCLGTLVVAKAGRIEMR